MPFDLLDFKTAIITGGGGGIGKVKDRLRYIYPD